MRHNIVDESPHARCGPFRASRRVLDSPRSLSTPWGAFQAINRVPTLAQPILPDRRCLRVTIGKVDREKGVHLNSTGIPKATGS